MSRRGDKHKKRVAQRRKVSSRKKTAAASFPDPRLLTVRVTEVGGVAVADDTFIFPVDRLRLPDGKVLAFHAPLVPALYLVTAKTLRDEGEAERTKVMETLQAADARNDWADLDVPDDSLAMDALSKLGSAVILAAGAVEAYANEAIDRLAETETVQIKRRSEMLTVPQAEMVRRLSLEEKLDLVLPKVTKTNSIKGRDPWPRFKRLNELRGEVVHVKARGRTDDPDVPSILGRLMMGEGSTCVEDAAAVITAYEETWLPEATRHALGL